MEISNLTFKTGFLIFTIMIRIDKSLLNNLSKKAKTAGRKRKNHNFHKSYSDTLQRMLNAIEPGSYVRPHKHENPDKNEAFLILKGSMVVVEFDESGNIIDHQVLDQSTECYGVEISPGIYHTIFALQTDSVAYELKDGPYDVETDKNFAPWAPAEDDPEAEKYLNNIIKKLNL